MANKAKAVMDAETRMATKKESMANMKAKGAKGKVCPTCGQKM